MNCVNNLVHLGSLNLIIYSKTNSRYFTNSVMLQLCAQYQGLAIQQVKQAAVMLRRF